MVPKALFYVPQKGAPKPERGIKLEKPEVRRAPISFIDAFKYRLTKVEVQQLGVLRDDPKFRRFVHHTEREIWQILHLTVHFILVNFDFHITSKGGRDIRAGMTHEEGAIEWSCEGLLSEEYDAAYYFFCQLRSFLAMERRDPEFTAKHLIAHGSDLKWPITEHEAEELIGLRKRLLASQHKQSLVQSIVEGILFGQNLHARIDWESWKIDFGNNSQVGLNLEERVWLGNNLNDPERLLSVVIICTLFTLTSKI
jgi:hypothetical protein